MPNEFTVVGENPEDRTRLLMIGADGRYYGHFPDQDRLEPVEPDERWTLFDSAEALEGPAPVMKGDPS